jgi:hypothetical protein
VARPKSLTEKLPGKKCQYVTSPHPQVLFALFHTISSRTIPHVVLRRLYSCTPIIVRFFVVCLFKEDKVTLVYFCIYA